MKTSGRWFVRGGLCLTLLAAFGLEAGAFYPIGDWNSANQLVIPRWPLSHMDVDGDGDVSGDDEGVLLNFQGGEDGWLDAEKAKLITGFETWEGVWTSYASFRYGPDIPDPVETEEGFGNIDLINIVAIDPEGTAGLAVTLNTWVIENQFVEVNGVTVPVTGGQFLDCDILFSGASIRQMELESGFGLRGTAVTQSGYLLGLSQSPLVNMDTAASQAEGAYVEKTALYYRLNGVLTPIGVSSAMVPVMNYVDDGSGNLADSAETLAPDDMAGITYLYPRNDEGVFFDLSQRARTQTRQGFASAPIAGAYIVAWCDVDNNPATARVPLFDTLTGLYHKDTTSRGHFDLWNLFRQLETQNGIPFTASYTFTCEPFEGLPTIEAVEEAKSAKEGEDFDSTNSGHGFDTGFISEVFREGENLLGANNLDQGTPLLFDPTKNIIVSKDNGKTLDQLLAAGRPMFGDQDAVCPLNVVVAGTVPVRMPNRLRSVRDGWLMQSAVGVAAVDAYYRTCPVLARFLTRHPRVAGLARALVGAADWASAHAGLLLPALVSVVALVWLGRRRRSARLPVALLVMGIVVGLGAPAAQAKSLPGELSLEKCVEQADEIVVGRVSAADSRWTADGKGIVTDVSIDVEDVLKGSANKNGQVHFQLPTGRVGGIIRQSPQLARYKEGEEVLVFLSESARYGFTNVGGSVGKLVVETDPDTGKKSVAPGSVAGRLSLGADLAALDAVAQEKAGEAASAEADAEADPGAKSPAGASLAVVSEGIRGLVKEQKRAARLQR